MGEFDAATLRLKQGLGVTLDRDAAAALGLSARAWAGRKKTGQFPRKELYELAAQRPELALDATYILTGRTQQQTAVAGAAAVAAQRLALPPAPGSHSDGHQSISAEEQVLLQSWRSSNTADRAAILQLAQTASRAAKT